MGTVKYSGPIASFHCPTEATIRSLKVHFSPKQEGSGTPSPDNVREIVGWDGVKVYDRSQNLIASETEWLSDKWIIDNGKLRHSVYYSFYIPAPKGTFYIHKKNTGLLAYGGLIDRPPEIGDTAYESVTLTSYLNRTVNNEEGHPYLLICGPSSDPNKTLEEWLIENEIWIDLINPSSFMKPYHGSTTNYEFGVLGKNKLNNDNEFWEVGSMDAMGGKDSRTTRIRTKDFIPAFPNTIYTISISEGYSFAYDEFYSGTHKYYYSWQSGSKTFTTHSDINQLFFIIKKDDTTNITPSILENDCHIQLELGSTATAYEPYNPNHTVYGGWVDLITGEVCETHYSEALSECNSEPLNDEYNTAQTTFFRCQHTYEHERGGAYGVRDLMCETLKSVGGNWGGNQDEKVNTITERYNSYIAVCMRMYNSDLGIDAEDDRVVRKTKVNAYLAQHPLFICYKLRTPNAYYLAPTSMQTFLSQNNVWSNADYVEIEYDLHETQTILARKQFIIANQPHTVKASGSLVNFTTDMAAALKECKVGFKPVQEGEGDPSPDNVRVITGWNNINIHRTGKNLIDENYLIDANNYPNAGNYGYYYTNDIQLTPNTRYRFVWYNYDNTALSEFGVTSINLYVQGASEYIVNNANYRQYSSGFLTPSTGIIRFGIYHPSSLQRQDVLNAIFNNGKLLLQIGTNDENYESYTGTTIPITFPSEAGTIYGGYVDLVTGEVWETWVKSTVRNIFTSVYTYNTTKVFWSNIIGDVSSNKSDIVSNKYPTISGLMPLSQVPNMADSSLAVRAVYGNLILKDTQYTTIEELYVAMGDTEICYHVATPTLITTLTPTALKSLRGTNNIWSNANGNIELSYWKH